MKRMAVLLVTILGLTAIKVQAKITYGVTIDTTVFLTPSLTNDGPIFIGTSAPTSYVLSLVDLSTATAGAEGSDSLGVGARADSAAAGTNQVLLYTMGLSTTSVPSGGQAMALEILNCDPSKNIDKNNSCKNLKGGALSINSSNDSFGNTNAQFASWARPGTAAGFHFLALQNATPFFFQDLMDVTTSFTNVASPLNVGVDTAGVAAALFGGFFAAFNPVTGATLDGISLSGAFFAPVLAIQDRSYVNRSPWQFNMDPATGDLLLHSGLVGPNDDPNGVPPNPLRITQSAPDRALVVSASSVTIAQNLVVSRQVNIGWQRIQNPCGAGVTTCSASCPIQTRVTGGGCDGSGVSLTTNIGNDTSWSCITSAATTLTASVYCARIGN